MRCWQAITVVVCLGFIWAVGCVSSESYERTTFYAHLRPDQVVPPTVTKGHGEFTMEIRQDGKQMYYRLVIGQVSDVTEAHIHLGDPGQNGPAVVVLFNGAKKTGEYDGTLAVGTFIDTDLVGPLEHKTIADLVEEIRRGNTYVNVHTDKYPDGEIRGQIQQVTGG